MEYGVLLVSITTNPSIDSSIYKGCMGWVIDLCSTNFSYNIRLIGLQVVEVVPSYTQCNMNTKIINVKYYCFDAVLHPIHGTHRRCKEPSNIHHHLISELLYMYQNNLLAK